MTFFLLLSNNIDLNYVRIISIRHLWYFQYSVRVGIIGHLWCHHHHQYKHNKTLLFWFIGFGCSKLTTNKRNVNFKEFCFTYYNHKTNMLPYMLTNTDFCDFNISPYTPHRKTNDRLKRRDNKKKSKLIKKRRKNRESEQRKKMPSVPLQTIEKINVCT